MLIFFVEILAKIFFVIRFNIVNLKNDKRKCELNILINDESSKLVIASA